MWHKAEWPQVRDISDGEAPGQSHWAPNSVSVWKPHPDHYSPTIWVTGEVVSWEGRQGSWAFPIGTCNLLFNQHHAPRNLKSSRMQFTIRVARRLFKGGDSTTNWEPASALGKACTAVPRKHGHHRLGATEVEKNLCTMKSAVKKKLFSQSILAHD